jgi:hypothetical protein
MGTPHLRNSLLVLLMAEQPRRPQCAWVIPRPHAGLNVYLDREEMLYRDNAVAYFREHLRMEKSTFDELLRGLERASHPVLGRQLAVRHDVLR